MKDLQQRILDRSIPEPNSGCWLWLLCDNGSGGYGTTCVNGRQIYAHRASYLAFKGPLEKGLFVCHKCHVRACVNPDHLYLGTHAENMRDLASKGRGRLSRSEVQAIFRDARPKARIAREYGVSRTIVDGIKGRRFYRPATEAL